MFRLASCAHIHSHCLVLLPLLVVFFPWANSENRRLLKALPLASVCRGPMRTILPVSFSFDMYFFIVVVDFERVFDIFLDEIFGFFFHARLLAAVRYPAKI